MNTYETLIYLATKPFEKSIALIDELKSSKAVLNQLKKEFDIDSDNFQLTVDTRQACETMVYQN